MFKMNADDEDEDEDYEEGKNDDDYERRGDEAADYLSRVPDPLS